jgi:hypothetical protein
MVSEQRRKIPLIHPNNPNGTPSAFASGGAARTEVTTDGERLVSFL